MSFFVDIVTEDSFYENLTLGVVRILENSPCVKNVRIERRNGCEPGAITSWEQRHCCALPEDVRNFYASIDGFLLSWSLEIAGNFDDSLARSRRYLFRKFRTFFFLLEELFESKALIQTTFRVTDRRGVLDRSHGDRQSVILEAVRRQGSANGIVSGGANIGGHRDRVGRRRGQSVHRRSSRLQVVRDRPVLPRNRKRQDLSRVSSQAGARRRAEYLASS